MLKLIFALLPLAAILGQAPAPKLATTAPKAAPQAAKPAAKSTASGKPAPPPSSGIQGIPVGAVKLDEITYRYQEKTSTGKPGTVWLYRRTPFGVSKVEEKEAAKIGQAVAAPVETPATATDLGDSYRFERPGPFGNKVWTKKKSELTDEERAIAEKSKTLIFTQKATN